MEFETVNLPVDIDEILTAIYKKAQKHNLELDKDTFLRQIIMEWLEPYERSENQNNLTLTRNRAVLKNNLKQAIKLYNKSITQVAKEIGVNRVYLSQIISGRYEPSVTVVLLLVYYLGCPVEKIKDLFYLEPAPTE